MDLPGKDEYIEFLKDYIIACRKNRVFGIKDNLFNIYRRHHGHPLSGGCTGFGCGAAFSFVALLPDGEVHACRKYPSKIGNILNSSLQDIYYSEKAVRYRRLPQSCKKCKLWKVCGGCPAVVYAQGLDPFVDRDPHCFVEEADKLLGEF